MDQNSIKASLLPKAFPQELEVGPRSGSYLLVVNYCWQGLETLGNGLNCMEICCDKEILYELLKVATFGKILPGKVKITGN